jgi:hypothetical protein
MAIYPLYRHIMGDLLALLFLFFSELDLLSRQKEAPNITNGDKMAQKCGLPQARCRRCLINSGGCMYECLCGRIYCESCERELRKINQSKNEMSQESGKCSYCQIGLSIQNPKQNESDT